MVASRKYADLVFKTSTKFPNWDPSKRIWAGDYGKINRVTGIFDKEGNIYEDGFIRDPAGADDLQFGQILDEWHTQSKTVQCHDVSLGPSVGMAGLADVALEGRWSFGRKRAALLIMYRPRIVHIPFLRLQDRLIEISKLHGKDIITDVYACPAFSLYLSSGHNETVALALRATPPMAPAGGQIQSAWTSVNTTGTYQAAGNTNGSQADFVPLFALKSIPGPGFWSRFRRGESDSESTDGHWSDYEVPWGDIDEDGEEEIGTGE